MRGRHSSLPTGTVTFLFTDIEGSTRLMQELGPVYPSVQNDAATIVRRAIAEGGGREVRTEGDAFFVAFETATGAIAAAAAAQRGLHGHPWPNGISLRIRMGIHTGSGVLGGDDYLGLDVNRAARIAAAASGGQILVSAATRGLVELDAPDGVGFRDVGEHRLKDLPRPEHLYQVVVEGLPSEFPPPRSLDVRPQNLPALPTSFIGRARELAELAPRVRPGRLLTLTGPGGTGKTRLALRLAEETVSEFPEGAFFVDLSSLAAPALVPSAIASAIGVREDAARPLIESVRDHLADKELLVVLDNFERVLEAAGVVASVASAAPRCAFLVTSRSPLRLSGEEEYPVAPLSLPEAERHRGPAPAAGSDAVALFADRAARALPSFALDDETTAAVAEICERLDGLPLAIELAASRVKHLSLAEITARLDRRLSLLQTGARDVPARQRTLRATIEWSSDLLDDPQRRLLARLSVFAAGATLESADAVANPAEDRDIDLVEGLSSLVDQSLLRRSEVSGESRFVMLETIREFARERLDASGEAEAVARRHADYFVALSERGERHFTAEDQAAWLDRFEREHENVRAAVRWSLESGHEEAGLRIASAIWRFWQHRGHLSEGREWLDALLSAPGAASRAIRARALCAAGSLAYWQNDLEAAERRYEESLSIARELGDATAVFDAYHNLAYIPWFRGDADMGWSRLRESLAMARDLGDKRRMAEAASGLAYAAFMREDYDAALPVAEEAIALARETGDRFTLAESVETRGQVHRMLGHYGESRDAYLESLRLKSEGGNYPGILTTLFMLSTLESGRGLHERALRLFGAAERMREDFAASPPSPALVLGDPIGAARAAIGDAAAERALREGRALDAEEAVAYAWTADA